MPKSKNPERTRAVKLWHDLRKRYRVDDNEKLSEQGKQVILICDEWNDFEKFYEWCLNNGWSVNSHLCRKNLGGDFCPDNCYLSDIENRAKYLKRCVTYELDGESRTLSDWCRIKNMTYKTVFHRMSALGWEFERAISTPIKKYNPRKTEEELYLERQEKSRLIAENQIRRRKERLLELKEKAKK